MSISRSRWPGLFAGLVVLTDLALINGAFVATSLFKFGTFYPTDSFAPIYLRFQVFLNLLLPVCLVLAGAYREIARAPLGHQAVTAFKACAWAAAVTLSVLFLERNVGYSRIYVTFLLAQMAVLIPFCRILLEQINAAARLRGHGVRPVLVVGEHQPLQDLAFRLRLAPHLGYSVRALLPVGFEPGADNGAGPRIVRNHEELGTLLASGAIQYVFICDRETGRERWKAVIAAASEASVEARLVPWPILVPDFRTRIHDLLAIPLASARVPSRLAGWGGAVKRLLDIVGSTTLLVLFSPLLALISLAIKLDSRGPVFYRQTRVTTGGRTFSILKFRSMYTLTEQERTNLALENEATGPLFKMKRDPRVTPVGAWLRRFSLDELPQILNVLKGELSLVGPRPPLPEEVEHYETWQRHRLEVVQGMTGLWQVSGRSRLSFEEMVLLDLHYIENWSLLLDIEILMETLSTVLHGDGAH